MPPRRLEDCEADLEDLLEWASQIGAVLREVIHASCPWALWRTRCPPFFLLRRWTERWIGHLLEQQDTMSAADPAWLIVPGLGTTSTPPLNELGQRA